jgi:hypothetical protein
VEGFRVDARDFKPEEIDGIPNGDSLDEFARKSYANLAEQFKENSQTPRESHLLHFSDDSKPRATEAMPKLCDHDPTAKI